MSLVKSIEVRDKSLARVARVSNYNSALFVPRFNEVGYWELEVPYSTDPASVAQLLLQDGAGIVVTKADGTTILSGPRMDYEHDFNQSGDGEETVAFFGPDDNFWLGARLASPQPGSSEPPYSTSAYDVRSGVASTVVIAYANANAGPGAVLPRQLANLVMAADPGLGSGVVGRARWQDLEDIVQSACMASNPQVGYRVVQVGNGLQLQLYQPVDRTGTVKFAKLFGNVRTFKRSVKAPSATSVVVAGGGVGTARVVVQGGPYTGTVLVDSPVGYWRLGEASGGTTYDQSGVGNNGTLANVALGAAALLQDPNRSATFNGASSSVSIPGAGALNIAANAPEALEVWLQLVALPAASAMLVGRSAGCSLLVNSTGHVVLGNEGGGTLVSTGVVTVGPLLHLVGVVDGINSRIYVNGVADPATGTVNPLATANNFGIGANVTLASSFASARIQEVAVYAAAPTATQVAAHYTAGTAANDYTHFGLIEEFRDRRDTTSVQELGQTILDELAKSGSKTQISLTTVETAAVSFTNGYGLGDKVTALVDAVTIQDVIREVPVRLTGDGAEVVQPLVGTLGSSTGPTMFNTLEAATTDVKHLETTQ